MKTDADCETAGYEHTLAGDDLRKLLKSSAVSVAGGTKYTANNAAVGLGSNVIDSDHEFDTLSPAVNLRDDGEYINCYTVTSHGRLQTQPWIHHLHHTSTHLHYKRSTQLGLCQMDRTTTQLGFTKTGHGVYHMDSTWTEQGPSRSVPGLSVDSVADGVRASGRVVMMELLRDIVFTQVDHVPQSLPQPSSQSCLKFVVDDSGMPSQASNNNNHAVHATPPPIPAKPTHLSVAERRHKPVNREKDDKVTQSTAVCSLTDVSDISATTSAVSHSREICPTTDVSAVHHQVEVTESDIHVNSFKCEENFAECDKSAAADDDDNFSAETVNKFSSECPDDKERLLQQPDTATSNQCHWHATLTQSVVTQSDTEADSDQHQSHCNDERQTAAASDIDRLYSFVRKKADRRQPVLDQRESASDAASQSAIDRRHELTLDQAQLWSRAGHNILGQSTSQIDSSGDVVCESIKQQQSLTEISEVKPTMRDQSSDDDDDDDDLLLSSDVQLPSTEVKLSSSSLAWSMASDNAIGSSVTRATDCVNDLLTIGAHHVTSVMSQSHVVSSVTSQTPAVLAGESKSQHVMRRGSLLVTELSQTGTWNESLTQSELHDCFTGTLLSYDVHGSAFYVPAVDMKVYGDPAGESWFYPVPLTPLQTTILLSTQQTEGCFLVYHEHMLPADQPGMESTQSLCGLDHPGVKYNEPSVETVCGSMAYNLSVSTGVDVLHYNIVTNALGDLSILGHQHSFLTLSDLINYFRHNKSTLATRLVRPLSLAHLPVTSVHPSYDASYELARSRLVLSGHIIANGRFGVICAGKYRSQHVAVKVLNSADTASMSQQWSTYRRSAAAAAVSREETDWMEEACCLMRVSHRSIVRLVGVVTNACPMYIVTELAARGNLKDCLRHNDVFALSDVHTLLDICMQVVCAVCYLASVEYMIHRDIAARNFLVTGGQYAVKLGDFGRARYVYDDNYQADISELISVKWSSPEVLLNSCYSTRSDLWAAAVVMWEVLTHGQRPYSSLSAEQTVVYVLNGGRLDMPDNCPLQLYRLMTSCWTHSPSDRPTATQIADRLQEISHQSQCAETVTSLQLHQSDLTETMRSHSSLLQSLASSSSSAAATDSVSSYSHKSSLPSSSISSRLLRRQHTWTDELDTVDERRYVDLPASSSSSSLSSSVHVASVTTMSSADDLLLTRADKIRHSLRKLVNVRL